MDIQESLGSIFLVTLMQLRQPKNVVKVTQEFLQCGRNPDELGTGSLREKPHVLKLLQTWTSG